MQNFFIIMVFLSIIAVPIMIVALLITAIRKKPLKQALIRLGICVALFLVGNIGGVATMPQNDKIDSSLPQEKVSQHDIDKSLAKLDKYPWGNVVSDALREIGVTKINKITPNYSDVLKYDTSVVIETNTKELNVSLSAKFDSLDKNEKPIYDWKVYSITEKGTDKYFMGVYYREGKPTNDLYDYKTDELIVPADEEAKKIMDDAAAENLKNLQEKIVEDKKEDFERTFTVFEEIYKAYKENELAADDKYKNKTFTLTATVDGMTEDGLVNGMMNTIGLTVMIKVDNTKCYLFCSFPDSERDKLKTYKNGSQITFTGKCLDCGNWSNCTLAD